MATKKRTSSNGTDPGRYTPRMRSVSNHQCPSATAYTSHAKKMTTAGRMDSTSRRQRRKTRVRSATSSHRQPDHHECENRDVRVPAHGHILSCTAERRRKGWPSRCRACARIGLIGGEGTGKTTLADGTRERPARLRRRRGPAGVRRSRGPHARAAASSTPCWSTRRLARRRSRPACPHAWLVADPAPLMTAVYSLLYFDDDSLVAPAVRHAAGYDLVVWCVPTSPGRRTASSGTEPSTARRGGRDHRAAGRRASSDRAGSGCSRPRASSTTGSPP